MRKQQICCYRISRMTRAAACNHGPFFSSAVYYSISSATQWCLTLCDPMDCSPPGYPVHHQLLELAQTHVHGVGGAIQPSHSLSSPEPPGKPQLMA